MAAADSLNALVGLGNLVGTVTGKSSTQKTTETTKGNITQPGVDRILEQILSGKGGVKDISGAARGAGLYNSSTELQLQNDLAARAAGEVAARQAGTTTERETQLNQPGLGIGSLVAPMIGMSLAKPLLDRVMGSLGIGDAAGAASAVPAASSSLGATGVSGAGSLPMGSTGAATGNLAGLSLGSATGGAAGINNVISGLTAANTGTALQGAGTLGGSLASDLGMSLAPGASAAGTAVQGASGFTDFLSNIPIVGNVLGGLLGGQNGDPFGSPLGFGSSLASGAMAMGPLGMIAAPVAATFGMMLSDLGVSVVCTALKQNGLLDKEEYEKGQKYLRTISKRTIRGYYHWGVPLALRIHKEEGKGKWTKLALPWARSRTKLIAAERGILRYFRYPLGTLTLVVGQPICYFIGGLLDLRDKLEGIRDGIRI